jgi:hypothetical protein
MTESHKHDPHGRAQRLALSKHWSQDAKSEIALFCGRLKQIYAREGLNSHVQTPNAEVGRPPMLHSHSQLAISDVGTASSRLDDHDNNTPEIEVKSRKPEWPSAARPLPPAVSAAICQVVEDHLRCADEAASGIQPQYHRWRSWWSGNCTEAAFRHIHHAEACLALLSTAEEIRAEIPDAVRRAKEALGPDDPTREVADALLRKLRTPAAGSTEHDDGQWVDDFKKLVEVGHTAADRQRSRLRTFRNVLLVGTMVTSLLLVAFVAVAALKPNLVPVCFVQEPSPDPPQPNVFCPTRSSADEVPGTGVETASGGDLFAVALLGLVGGALSAAVFIRDLYTNATPYNVSIPLAMLKLPAGAMTALAGIILLAGEFVPGFTAVDKQIQILAYALVFGFAQQLFTQVVDQRARRLVSNVPTKARGISAPERDRGASIP